MNDEVNELVAKADKRYFKPFFVQIRAPENYYQIDLMDMSNISRARGNQNNTFGLLIIEVASRKGWLYPLRTKHAHLVAQRLAEWYPEAVAIRGADNMQVQSDAGSEFKGEVKAFFNQHGIEHRVVDVGDKNSQAIAERWIKTLRERFRVKWLENDNYDWVSHIDDVVEDYNDTEHRSMKTTPNKVWNGLAVPQWKLKGHVVNLQRGDYVRLYVRKNTFAKKSNIQNWTREVFEVDRKDGHKFVLHGLEGRWARWALKRTEHTPTPNVTKQRRRELYEDYQEMIRELRNERELVREGIEQENVIKERRREIVKMADKLPEQHKRQMRRDDVSVENIIEGPRTRKKRGGARRYILYGS